MYIQIQNLSCSSKHRHCPARLQTVFGSWVSHCSRISLRDVVQCIRSPPAPEAAFWGSCSGFCRLEIQEVTESFLVHLRWEHGFDLTKPCLSKTKTTSCTYFEQQNTTAALRMKKVFVFFFPWENYFQGQKLLHIASKERRSSIWSWPLSVLEGVCETFQLLHLESNSLRPSFTAISELVYGAMRNGEQPLTFLRIYECFKV